MLLTNKIYEGNLFMRYSKHLTYAERMFLRARLNRVRHITLDPDGPGVPMPPGGPLGPQR